MALKAHVGFAIPDADDIGRKAAAHFERFGYQLIEQGPTEWVFQRGKKSAVLWRFDVRAYFTTLTVRAVRQKNGELWVSCDWEVFTLMSIVTAGDVQTLEAEGRELETVLRTMD